MEGEKHEVESSSVSWEKWFGYTKCTSKEKPTTHLWTWKGEPSRRKRSRPEGVGKGREFCVSCLISMPIPTYSHRYAYIYYILAMCFDSESCGVVVLLSVWMKDFVNILVIGLLLLASSRIPFYSPGVVHASIYIYTIYYLVCSSVYGPG